MKHIKTESDALENTIVYDEDPDNAARQVRAARQRCAALNRVASTDEANVDYYNQDNSEAVSKAKYSRELKERRFRKLERDKERGL